MSSLKKSFLMTAVATLLFAGSASANSITYNFAQITNNGNVNVASQLSVEVIDLGGNQVAFKFFNNVGTASSITDIYFDDGTLLAMGTISSSAGVAFTAPATPSNLPGGQNINFNTTQQFSLDANNPSVANGVNAANEWIMVAFTLQNGQTWADTIAALASGALRIGVHVQGIGPNGDSNSFVSSNTVPDGGSTMALLGSALFAAGLIGRRFNRS